MVDINRNDALEASVLVLNRSYIAVRVVNVRRAFVLLCREVAEVVHIEDGTYANYDFDGWRELSEFRMLDDPGLSNEAGGEWIRTVRFRIQVPRVIRLLRFNHLPRQSVRLSRKNVFARDENCCQYCGKDFPASQLSFDHVKPRSRGGETNWENVVTCCLDCNSRKGNRTPQEAGMQLRRRPTRPAHNPVLQIKLGNPRYHVWHPFLNQAGAAIEIA